MTYLLYTATGGELLQYGCVDRNFSFLHLLPQQMMTKRMLSATISTRTVSASIPAATLMRHAFHYCFELIKSTNVTFKFFYINYSVCQSNYEIQLFSIANVTGKYCFKINIKFSKIRLESQSHIDTHRFHILVVNKLINITLLIQGHKQTTVETRDLN